MKIAIFSIATYSKLEEAKVLLDSVFIHASWAQTFIFLAEKSDSLEILKSDTFGHKVVTLSELAIENLNQLAFQYKATFDKFGFSKLSIVIIVDQFHFRPFCNTGNLRDFGYPIYWCGYFRKIT